MPWKTGISKDTLKIENKCIFYIKITIRMQFGTLLLNYFKAEDKRMNLLNISYFFPNIIGLAILSIIFEIILFSLKKKSENFKNILNNNNITATGAI